MTAEELRIKLREDSKSPKGFKDTVDFLFKDPQITYDIQKNVNEMSDKVLFSYQGEIVYTLENKWRMQ